MPSQLKQLDVAFIIPFSDDGKIMLGYKKEGLGKGKLTLFGGKIEDGETPQQGVLRELLEEASVKPVEPIHRLGRLIMDIKSVGIRLVTHIFRCNGIIGVPVESYEMTIEWVPVDKIPFELMWLDNKFWFPYLIDNQPFEGEFVFEDENTLTKGYARPKTPRSLLSIASAKNPSPIALPSARLDAP